jgi:hypothetical protein
MKMTWTDVAAHKKGWMVKADGQTPRLVFPNVNTIPNSKKGG